MFPIHSTVPTRHQPLATWVLMAINVGIFWWQASLGHHELEWVLRNLALIPGRLLERMSGPEALYPATYVPLLANTFLHGGWLHLILNMWTLWLFGPAVEDRFDHARFVAFYLACGFLASVAHAVTDPGSLLPAVGASGAIAGVLGAYTVMFPLSRIVVLVPLAFIPLFFTVPALLFTGLWFLTQLYAGTSELVMPHNAAGIAWWAHVGGFVAGMLLTPLIRRKQRDDRDYAPDECNLGCSHAKR